MGSYLHPNMVKNADLEGYAEFESVEVSANRRVKKKCTRGHIMHQNKYFKALRPLVTA